jgi:ZIP family zinc transporter
MSHDLLSTNVLVAFLVCVLAASATLLGGLSIIQAQRSNPRLLAWGLAFAGGAMVYISLVEILVKSQDSFKELWSIQPAYAGATAAFFLGIGLMVLLDRLLPNPHLKLSPRGKVNHPHVHTHLKRVGLFATLAITAHNFPEGMATFFATLEHPSLGVSLAVAIAIHNIPEGISIAIPVFYATGSRRAAMGAVTISAVAEPVGALVGYMILAPFLSPLVYGILFGVIAGAMVYLALDELLPSARRYAKGHETLYGLVAGMAVLALSLVLFK